MSPESPNNLEQRLKEIEARSREANKENPPKRFETETGFLCTVFFYKEGLKNLHLEKSGLYSTFSVNDGTAKFAELRGPDDELLDNPDIINQHKEEVSRLLAEDKLDRVEPIKDQMDLDLRGEPVDLDED